VLVSLPTPVSTQLEGVGTVMGTLAYVVTVSIDGYAADADGDFRWTAPTEAVFAVHLDRMAEVSTEVPGRRTYALMGVLGHLSGRRGPSCG
jgi:hypothetical protein